MYFARTYSLARDELRYILDPKDVYGDAPQLHAAVGEVR
jgi:hypothetical protein